MTTPVNRRQGAIATMMDLPRRAYHWWHRLLQSRQGGVGKVIVGCFLPLVALSIASFLCLFVWAVAMTTGQAVGIVPTWTPTANHTPTPTSTPTLTPMPPTSAFTPTPKSLGTVEAGVWRFAVEDAELLPNLGSKRPSRGAFLVLLGTLQNRSDERGCTRNDGWALVDLDVGEVYALDTGLLGHIKERYSLDYPGSFMGLCVDAQDERQTFLAFDVAPTHSVALRFLGSQVILGRMDSLVSTPWPTSSPTLAPPAPTRPPASEPSSAVSKPTSTSPSDLRSSPTTEAQLERPGVVTADTLNVRAGPRVSATRTGVLHEGDVVPILEETRDEQGTTWYRVGDGRWVNASYVELLEESTPQPTPRATPTRPRPQMVNVKLALLASRGTRTGAGHFVTVEGEVKNISDSTLEDVVAVISVYDENGVFVTSDSALIEYTTLLPGQTSPFEVIVDYNPRMAKYKVEFKYLLGGRIPTRDDRPSTSASRSRNPPPECPDAGARITYPGIGDYLSGVVPFKGSANVANFQYYKLEYRPVGEQSWQFLVRFDRPVTNGTLMEWHTDTVPRGEYELRLVVVDRSGNFPKPCVIRVRVSGW